MAQRLKPIRPTARLYAKNDVPRGAMALPGPAPDLRTVLFLRVGDRAVSFGKRDLKELKLTADEAIELAAGSLRTAVPVKVRSEADGLLWTVQSEVPFVSGYALALGALPKVPKLGKLGALVALPSAHLMAVAPLTRKSIADEALQAMVPGTLQAHGEAAEPLSRNIYWVRGDEWLTIEITVKDMMVQVKLPKAFQEATGLGPPR